ncbi:MAG: hypothetical protein FOGNACKC_00887 [Anaerolineae bacterium]|nr:hypothetical protein [Anaerolineae bacterium]
MSVKVKLEPVKTLTDIEENGGKYTAIQQPGGERVFLGGTVEEASLVLAMMLDTHLELEVWPNGLGATYRTKGGVWEIWRPDPAAGYYHYRANFVRNNGFYVERKGVGPTPHQAIENAEGVGDDGDI